MGEEIAEVVSGGTLRPERAARKVRLRRESRSGIGGAW